MKNIGIDIGKKKCVICVTDERGKVLEESSYENTAKDALKFAVRVKSQYGKCRAVCESTGNHWIKTADAFEHAGVPFQLANPFQIKAIAWARIKTDTIDARMLAHLLRADLIPQCHIGSVESRGIRQMIGYQRTLVQDRTKSVNYLHSLTDKYDVNPKDGGCNIWSYKALAYLDGVHLGCPSDQIVLERCISKIRYYNDEIKKMNHAIRLYVKESHDAQLLLTITGIDVFTAALVASEIDGIKRFASPKKLVSWSGMCPTVHQSGDTAYHGKMKKDSNRKVNWAITQCALSAAVHDPRMKACYEHLKKRHKPSVAITHVANKMITIIWYMLTNNTEYTGVKKSLHNSKMREVMNTQ